MRRAAVLWLIVILAGCQPNKEPSPAPAPAPAPAATVDPLRQMASLEKRINALEIDKTMRDVQNVNAAWFDPQDPKNYVPLKSPAGPVLMVLENMEPYLDGFKVTFRVGNPTSAGLIGVKGKISWGPAFDPNNPTADVQRHTKEFDDPRQFPAGAWTHLTINFGPATAAQARQIAVEPVFNQVRMRSPVR